MQDPKMLQGQVKDAAVRIAMLLQASNIPQEEKDAWAAVIPELTLEQIDQLVPYLISNIPEEARQAVSALFDQIQQAEKEHQDRVAKANEGMEAALAVIENELNEA